LATAAAQVNFLLSGTLFFTKGKPPSQRIRGFIVALCDSRHGMGIFMQKGLAFA
jgi:hypothetical protein